MHEIVHEDVTEAFLLCGFARPHGMVNGAAEVLRNISSDFCKKCVLNDNSLAVFYLNRSVSTASRRFSVYPPNFQLRATPNRR